MHLDVIAYHPKKWFELRVVDFAEPHQKSTASRAGRSVLAARFWSWRAPTRRWQEVLTTLTLNFINNGSLPPRAAEAWMRETLGKPFKKEDW